MFRNCPAFVVAMLLAIVSFTSVAPAQADAERQRAVDALLAQVPDTALGMVVVPNPEQANKRVMRIVRMVEPGEDDDPMSEILEEIGGKGWVDTSRPAGLYVPRMPAFMQGEEPQVVGVIPVKDRQRAEAAFKQQGAAAADADGIMTILSERDWRPDTHIKFLDGYVLYTMGDRKALAKHVPARQAEQRIASVGKLGKSIFYDSDIYIYVNTPRLGPPLAFMATAGIGAMQMQIANADHMSEYERASAHAALAMVGAVLNASLTHTQGAIGGYRFAEDGVYADGAVQFKPDTTATRVLGTGKQPQPTLDRLPDEPVVMAVAVDQQAIDLKPLIEAMREQIVPTMPEGTGARRLLETQTDGLALWQQFTGMQAAWYPPENAEQSPLRFASVMLTRDKAEATRKAVLEEYRKSGSLIRDLMGDAAGEQARPVYQIVPDATRIDGRSVDRITFDSKAIMAPEVLRDMPPVFEKLMDMNVFMTHSDDALVATVGGPSTALLGRTMASVGGGGKLAARPEIRKLFDHLPEGRFAEAYLDVGAMIMAFATTLAEDDKAPDVPAFPMAISASVTEGGLGISGFMPNANFKNIEPFGEAMEDFVRGRPDAAVPRIEVGPAAARPPRPVQAIEDEVQAD